MSIRPLVGAGIFCIAVLGFVAWVQSTAKTKAAATAEVPPEVAAPAEPPPAVTPPFRMEPAGDPGVSWSVPRGWIAEISPGLRLASYIVPGRTQTEDAQCAVHYFGKGAGGGVELNTQRWIGEFLILDRHAQTTREVGGIRIHRLEAHGTYASHGMQGDDGSGGHPGWALIGAIVEGPEGDLFFKLTGPEATVAAAAGKYDAMLSSLKKKPAAAAQR